ncbi:MAG: hypothetical protein K1W34_18725 [Lachnospiraceae bacterium]
MYEISSLTMLSNVLGPPSALISFADKFPDWIDEAKYRRKKNYIHEELLHELYTVQKRAETRLEKYISDSDFSDINKNEYRDLLKKIQQDDAIYWFRNLPYHDYLSEDGFGRLIAGMKKLQERYKNNDKAEELENLYTGFFYEEMAHFDMLGKWYNYTINRTLLEKAFEIQKELAVCDRKIGNILNDTASIQESVNTATQSVIKGNQILHGFSKAFDNISLYAALAIIGTGVVFLFGVLVGIKLDPIYLVGTPICLFLSDLFVRGFRQKDDEAICTASKQSWWFVLMLTILQTIIATTIVFVISGVFSNNDSRNFCFWILSLLLGSLTIQIIRNIKLSKF